MKHRDQVVKLLRKQIGNLNEVHEIQTTAEEVGGKWVSPLSGGKEQTNGLIYGLVQSGKTGVLTFTGAIGADEGYRTLLILTSDIGPLYDQTLGRAREAFPGMDIISKSEFKDRTSFLQRVKSSTCVIVATKNSSILRALVQNFKKGNLKGLSCLIFDDEADQASLNTKERKADGSRSAINDLVVELRTFFDKNTYLQVTATPQALFLQTPGHDFRPKFTVLSHPGSDYVGGEDFFGANSQLVREFAISDISALSAGAQPTPGMSMPASLQLALDTFIVAATYKRNKDVEQNCAFLCHVSTKTDDHEHIVDMMWKYKIELSDGVKTKKPAVIARLRKAFDDLGTTHADLHSANFNEIVDLIEFFTPGITVKLVNGDTDEDVAVRSPYNLFVGGNKLGRGVTIKNLLVSYYGRNPVRPQADTVLQHARMYGYRRADIGLLRLFLPAQLHNVFRAINKMEYSLRDLIARRPTEEFRGIYVEGNLHATRKNILAPGAIGMYTGGSTYNPAQVRRDDSVKKSTTEIDNLVKHIADKSYATMNVAELAEIIKKTSPDDSASENVWNAMAVAESVDQWAVLHGTGVGYVYVDRDRALKESRRETQGVLSGGEAQNVPSNLITLFLLRTVTDSANNAAWWPQIRFPDGQYAFAFAI